MASDFSPARDEREIPDEAVLVFNPGSGKGKGAERASDFAAHWKQRVGRKIRLRATTSKEDIRVAAAESRGRGELPIFMGGDGTLSEGVQGLAEASGFEIASGPPVGFLAGGTGNSFLRDFGITGYEDAREALLDAVAAAESTPVDSAILTYRQCHPDRPGARGAEVRRIMFNIFGVGLISDITELAVKMRSLGPANYRVATLAKILTHRPRQWTATIDGKKETIEADMITLSNSRFTGGDMEIAPEVRVNDGRLFLAVIQAHRRLELLALFPRVLRGDYEGEPRLLTRFIETLRIEQESPVLMNVDGELEAGYDPEITIVSPFFRLLISAKRL